MSENRQHDVRMHIRDATEADLPGILAIHNDAVLATTAIWRETPVDLDDRRAWFSLRQSQGCPVLVASLDEEVLGYASFGDFRTWPGYRHTVEHSVYVQHSRQRQGVGGALLGALIERARAADKHVMIAGIEAGNTASLRLHERWEFSEAGRLAQVGTKFGRWLDLVFMQRILGERPAPAGPAPRR
jgi:phosphinothricin acetyltransferase